MPTRNINVTDHLDRFIEAEVGSGRYGNASEVVREGLRLIERRKWEERAKLRWLRGAVREGLDQIDHGEGVESGHELASPCSPVRTPYSHALAIFQSRLTVSGEIPRTSAVSSTLNPPK